MIKNISIALCALLVVATLNTACNTSRKVKGAVIGATVGGATGAILSKDNRAVGIILGAAVGGVAGGLIGSYMDKQARDIADDLGKDATVTRVGEGIVVSFDSGLLFDFDSDALRTETKSNLQKLATSLKEYDDTVVNVLGHTDSVGSSAYNKTLSTRRAASVENYLITQGVGGARVHPLGYGESDPVATNDSESGRQLNRRVEIVIVANDELKRTARDGSVN
jgi:outer membrane protein OmpA-like peptidoglycan-associated protein